MRALQRIRMGCIGWRCYFINEARSLPALSIQHSAFSFQQGKPLFVSQETFWSSADPGLDYGLICFYCANLHAVSIYLLWLWNPNGKSASGRLGGMIKTGRVFSITQDCGLAKCIRWNI